MEVEVEMLSIHILPFAHANTMTCMDSIIWRIWTVMSCTKDVPLI